MVDKYYYICDYKRKISDGKCSGAECKFLGNGESLCERTADAAYAKNKFDKKNFEFITYQAKGDLDIWSERNEEGDYI